MVKGLAVRLLSVLMFSGVVLAACNGPSGNGAPADAGARDAWVDAHTTTDDAANDSTVGNNDDGGQDGASDGGAICAPGSTRCAGNG